MPPDPNTVTTTWAAIGVIVTILGGVGAMMRQSGKDQERLATFERRFWGQVDEFKTTIADAHRDFQTKFHEEREYHDAQRDRLADQLRDLITRNYELFRSDHTRTTNHAERIVRLEAVHEDHERRLGQQDHLLRNPPRRGPTLSLGRDDIPNGG